MSFRYGTAVALWMAGAVYASSINTTPNPTSVTLGTSSVTLKDTATLSGATNPTGTITFTLLYPSSTVDTETVTVNGDGSYTTPTGFTLPTNSTVTGMYQWNASYGGDGSNGAASDINNPLEQVVVAAANPFLNTTPGGPLLPVQGNTLTDTAILTGSYFGTGTITFLLYAPSSSTPIYSDIAVVSGNGVYSTSGGNNPGGYALPASGSSVIGSYEWLVSYSGDGNNHAVAGVEYEDVVPEPSSLALLCVGLGAVILRRTRHAT